MVTVDVGLIRGSSVMVCPGLGELLLAVKLKERVGTYNENSFVAYFVRRQYNDAKLGQVILF